jgi:hypothetical protein
MDLRMFRPARIDIELNLVYGKPHERFYKILQERQPPCIS